jgi:hypothetical protein
MTFREKKLSRNRADIEKWNFIESLPDCEDASARFIASYLREELGKKTKDVLFLMLNLSYLKIV